jgi:hypothetical protein
MSARQCVALGLRLFAVWICLDAIQAALSMGALDGPRPFLWQRIVGISISLVMALLVWVLSGPVAKALMSGLTHVPDVKFSPHQAVMVGCVLMGLWWLEQSLFVLVELWLHALAPSPDYEPSASDWFRADRDIEVFSRLLQIGVALFFVCRPDIIANKLLRHLPVPPDAPPSSPASTAPLDD